jgi:hypothetical protein
MSDEQQAKAPEAVRKIAYAIVDQAFARCERMGVSREDFHRALLEEQTIHSSGDVADLIERAFRRLARTAN